MHSYLCYQYASVSVKVNYEIQIFNFEYLSSGHNVLALAKFWIICGYFSKRKLFRKQKFGKHCCTDFI